MNKSVLYYIVLILMIGVAVDMVRKASRALCRGNPYNYPKGARHDDTD